MTVIQNGKAVKKEKPQPPNASGQHRAVQEPPLHLLHREECDQIFELSSNGKYRCIYCEQELQVKPE